MYAIGLLSTASSKAGQQTLGPAARRRDWGLQEGDRLVITGSLPQLGNWQPRHRTSGVGRARTPQCQCSAVPKRSRRKQKMAYGRSHSSFAT